MSTRRTRCFDGLHSAFSQESICIALIRLGSLFSPEPDTWDTSSLLWEHRGEEGSGRRCGSCRHSRHTATDGLPLPHCYTPDTRPDPPGEQREEFVMRLWQNHDYWLKAASTQEWKVTSVNHSSTPSLFFLAPVIISHQIYYIYQEFLQMRKAPFTLVISNI